ncbi:prenylated Rab acceptor protein 1 [Corvus hawaiiensis]|uniref:prenylated Rab acceptor protein 1 n=1 Tax=Corvus hawaiiensis TaxID=134902 RepID=UPI002019C90D|nr:prenylated Rab acceptor protein 1 [Corvus hawaiiensis]
MTSSRSPAPRHAFLRIRPQTPQKTPDPPMAEAKPPPRSSVRPRERPRAALGRLSPPGWARAWLEARRAGSGPGGPSWTSGVLGSPGIWGSSCGAWGTTPRDSEQLPAAVPGARPLLPGHVPAAPGGRRGLRGRCHRRPAAGPGGATGATGRELTPAHQLAVAGGVSLPLFWLAGAGAAVFWVLGAALVFLGSHAAFRQLEPPETPELQMEPV